MWWFLLACDEPVPTGAGPDTAWEVPHDSPPEDDVEDTSAPRPRPPLSGSALRERVDPVQCPLPEGATLAGPVRWWVNGAPFSGLTLERRAAGDTVFAGHTRAGDTWQCIAELTDGGSVEETLTVAAFDAALLDPPVAPVVWLQDGVLHYRGPLAGAASLTALYGVDGWSLREAPEGAVQFAYPEGDFRTAVVGAMHREPAGWALPVQLPATAHAVSAIFTAGATVDDNAGQEYTWDIVFPSIGPFLTWNDLATPSTGIVVNWATGQPGHGRVEYGPDRENTAFVADSRSGTLHHVALTGLPADTSFVYRVWDSSGRASPWSSFRTAETDADTFTFLVASDMQDAGTSAQRWPEIAAAMAEEWPDARFVIAPGDLATNDHPGWWWLFFDGGRELFSRVPLVPALGNHDTPGVPSSPDTRDYRRWFDLPTGPADEDEYRLDYGRTRCFALNTEVRAEMEPGGAQYEWLKSELDELRDGTSPVPDWVLTFGHHPGYDIGKRFAVETPDYRSITQLYDGAVDLDIRAHEHIYQRFDPLRYPVVPAASYGRGDDQGVAYVVTPSAGFASLATAVIGRGMFQADQLDVLAWPELAEDATDAPELHGILVGKVSPAELTLEFVAFGSGAEPTTATVEDRLLIQR